VLTLSKGANVLLPVKISDPKTDLLVAITNQGRMLAFSVSDLPMLAKGKGNKIIGIPAKDSAARTEFVVVLASVPEGKTLKLYSGQRHFTIKRADFANYMGERGRRGNKLPRGFQTVDKAEVGE